MRAIALSLLALAACGTSLPAPPKSGTPPSSFVEVPYPPPPARVERIPDRPPAGAVWIDGSWAWTGSRWRWKDGGWFAQPAAGVGYASSELRRPGGARLLFAGASWRDPGGGEVPGPRQLASASMAPSVEEDAGAPGGGPAVDGGR